MTTRDSATTWRDLADALTPQQVAYLEDWERHPGVLPRADGSAPTLLERQRALLFTAREFVGSNAAAALYADVAAPPDATGCRALGRLGLRVRGRPRSRRHGRAVHR